MLVFPRLKKKISTSPVFWRFRSWVEPRWYESYIEDWNAPRRQVFANLARETGSAPIVFEFGCAAAPNLFLIKRALPLARVIGVDINPQSVKYAQRHFQERFSDGYDFFTASDASGVEKRLQHLKILTIDCAIFDRVLYLFGTKQCTELFELLSHSARTLIIDDFFSSPATREQYQAHDFNALLKVRGYKMRRIEKSGHKVTSSFHDRFAKLAVFDRS